MPFRKMPEPPPAPGPRPDPAVQVTSRTFDCNLLGEEGSAVYLMPVVEMINHDDNANAERNGAYVWATGGGR